MINEQLAEKAKDHNALKLERFPEFVGVGIVQLKRRSPEMAVAVYVSRPRGQLSVSFRESVPATVTVTDHGSSYKVPTKIVNIGELHL
jgi:hypothetical protein